MERGDSTHLVEESAGPPELHVWIRVRQMALDRHARYAKMAIDAGVEERRVQLAERWGDDLARMLGNVLEDLNLTPAQAKKAPEIIRRNLISIEGRGRPLQEVA